MQPAKLTMGPLRLPPLLWRLFYREMGVSFPWKLKKKGSLLKSLEPNSQHAGLKGTDGRNPISCRAWLVGWLVGVKNKYLMAYVFQNP